MEVIRKTLDNGLTILSEFRRAEVYAEIVTRAGSKHDRQPTPAWPLSGTFAFQGHPILRHA